MDDSLYLCSGTESIKEVVEKLHQSEQVYHDRLNKLSDLYILHLKTCVVSWEELEKMLLGKIKDLIDLSQELLSEILEGLSSWDEDSSQLGDLFLRKADFWDLYRHYSTNLGFALSKYNEKMNSADFAALVALKQGLKNAALEDLILLPIYRLKEYRKIFDIYLEKTVGASFTFSHPDFSNAMKCKKQIEDLIPDDLERIQFQNKVEEYSKLEAMMGDVGKEFTAYIKQVHEEPTTSKSWKKKSANRKSNSRSKSESVPDTPTAVEKIDIGGKKYDENNIVPDILNAVHKEQETQVMTGMGSVTKIPKVGKSPPAYYISKLEEKVKIKWESEVHHYSLILFKQCIIFCKIRNNKSMKVCKIILLKKMWISDYEEGLSSIANIDNTDTVFIGGWLGSEGWDDDDLIHRVVFHFPNIDIKNYWYILLQRQIEESKSKFGYHSGSIEVCYKASYSHNPILNERRGQGLACKNFDVDINDTVSKLIELAVKECQMKEGKDSYKLYFIIMENKKIVYEDYLIGKEFPLIIQNETKYMYPSSTKMEILFVLRHCYTQDIEHITSRQRVNTLTTFFRGRLGTGKPAAMARLPAMSELSLHQRQEIQAGAMFGVPLSKFMSNPQEVPAPLMDILFYIYNHCYTIKGIFREPGVKKVEKAIRVKLDSKESWEWSAEQINLTFSLPNVAASLLKSYFRSLPGGLFLKSLWPEFEKWRNITEEAEKLSYMKHILSMMPPENMCVAKYLLYVLKKICDNSSINMMNANNISKCIGMSLIMWPDDANSLSLLADAESQLPSNLAVEFLLEHIDDMFGPTPVFLLKSSAPPEQDAFEDEVVSRRSKLSELEDVVNSSDDEADKNIWLKSLFRQSINEDSPSSSMFVEVGSPSPTLSVDRCIPAKITETPENNLSLSVVQSTVDPPECVTPTNQGRFVSRKLYSPATQTARSEPVPKQMPHSTFPEQCELESDTDKEQKPFFSFNKKTRQNSQEKKVGGGGDADIGKKKRTSSLRKSKKKDNTDQVKDFSSEDESRKIFDRSDPARKNCTGSMKKRVYSTRCDTDSIQQVVEQSTAKRVIVKHTTFSGKSAPETQSVQVQEPIRRYERAMTLTSPVTITATSTPVAKEGHDLCQLVSSLEKLTDPKRRLSPYRRYLSGSVESGTDSTSSTEDDPPVNMEQESYV